MTREELLEYYKNWLRNAAGGAYNTAAGLTALPIQAASVLSQLPGLLSKEGWEKGITVPDPLKGGRKAFADLTGLPVEQAEPGYKAAFGFGRGAVPGPTMGAAVIGGATNAIAEQVSD